MTDIPDDAKAIIMCMRTAVEKEPVLGSTKTTCTEPDCEEEIWLGPEMMDGTPRPALHEGEIVMGSAALARPVCGRCAVKLADEEGDWSTAAHLRHMISVVEGIEV